MSYYKVQQNGVNLGLVAKSHPNLSNNLWS